VQYFYVIKSGEAGYNLHSDMRKKAELCYRECGINCAWKKANEIRVNINPKEKNIKTRKHLNVNEEGPGVGHLMDNGMQRSRHPAARALQELCER